MKNVFIFVALIINVNVFAAKNISLIGKDRVILTSFGVNYKHPIRPVKYFSIMEHYKNLSLENIEGEIWKDVGYEGLYLVSNYGRIKILSRPLNCGVKIMWRKEKICKTTKNKYGYINFSATKNYKKKTPTVHRAVAKSFIENPLNKKTVNHINGIKTDNIVENLEWATDSENEFHSYRVLGRYSPKGGNHYKSKRIVQKTVAGEVVKIWDCQSTAARELKIHQTKISAVCLGNRKTAGGFKWDFL